MAFKKNLSLHTIPAPQGIAALPTVLIIAGLTLLMTLAILGSGILESLIAGAQKESGEAFFKAETGIKDALQRITRNPGFSFNSYNPISGDSSISVTVENSPCASITSIGHKCITSIGVVSGKTRKIRVGVNLQACLGGSSNGLSCVSGDSCVSGGGSCVVIGKITQVLWEELSQ